jgi:hypothetical protein
MDPLWSSDEDARSATSAQVGERSLALSVAGEAAPYTGMKFLWAGTLPGGTGFSA